MGVDPNQAIYLGLLSVIRERIAFVQRPISEFREHLDDPLCNEVRAATGACSVSNCYEGQSYHNVRNRTDRKTNGEVSLTAALRRAEDPHHEAMADLE